MPKIVIVTALVVFLLANQQLQAGFSPIIRVSGEPQWQAGPGMPEAGREGEGTKFVCRFNASATRFFWDCPAAADLTKSATVELELSCPNHEVVQSVGLYLKSGNGWYLWIRPIVKSGRQKFFLQIKDAATEGRPAGWHKISGVRVSFQNNIPANTFMLLHGLKAGASDIILVKGTLSAPDNGEKKVAEKTVERLSKWLEDAGVGYSVLDDEDVTRGRLRSAAVIILPYNPHLGDRELGQLEKLSANGSKLIVFYGTEPRLADLLDVKLGKYQAAGEPGQWNGFQFNRSAPEGTPARIIQQSGNIYTVFPKSENGRIIAFWQDSSGKLLSDPAWIQSDRGFWMTHIMLGEDSENKKRMLVAMLGYCEKRVWKEAAQNIIWQFEGDNCPSSVMSLFDKGDYIEVVERAGKIRQNFTKNSAMNQAVKDGEFRGVWNHSGLGLYPGNWNKTCQLLSQSGITAVFPNVLWAGMAHYPSKFVGQSEESKKYGNQLAQCVAAARGAGLEVHVWKVCWNLALADKTFIEDLKKQGRLQRDKSGETISWLCPSDPANIALELDVLREVLNNYDVDGIHLDYIRYPDAKACYCAGCRRRYEKWVGQTVSSWPRDVSSGRQRENYQTWRSLQITEFVRGVRGEIKKIKPRVKLSAAVYPKYPECIESIGQDWALWLREGLLDFACPMDYLPTVSAFRETLDSQLALQNGRKRIYPGIGATLSEGDLSPEIFLGQIRTLRARGVGGFMLFDLNPSLAANFLPLIGSGTGR